MILSGKLFVESPIYRGNARKTLFTRDGDGTQRLVSLAGEIEGTAQSLMDAFIGKSRDGRNIGLLNKLWLRLYKAPLPERLIRQVKCKLNKESYPRDRLFDLRMGIKLDEDRGAAEAKANYKMETLFKNSAFDFTLEVSESLLNQDENEARLYYVLKELKEGKFWFGAGKSKGLGRCRLEMDIPFSTPQILPLVNPEANHLSVSLHFSSRNPILVGWNWGKVDPEVPAFAAIEGRALLEAMRNLAEPIRKRLEMAIGGPLVSPKDWKNKLADYLPRIIAIKLREDSVKEGEVWILPPSAIKKLQKGKYPLSPEILEEIQPLCEKPFSDKQLAEKEIKKILGKKANLANRILEHLESKTQAIEKFDHQAWLDLVSGLGLEAQLAEQLESQIKDENAMVEVLRPACQKIMPQLFDQIDRQINLLQSDLWIDMEIANREEHIKIKTRLLSGNISETEWENPAFVPEGIKPAGWKEFLASHARVGFRYLINKQNLEKSIINDKNHISFLNGYRNRTRQELAQPYHTDFRAGGPSTREISKKYGKPYDNIFMRMLTWSLSSETGTWEIYIPGSTIKGAFRKRASQVLKTLWGETPKTRNILDRLFGKQGQRGLVFFSDAYLTDPKVPENSWCSMDGVRMDAQTGQPIEEAKADYLFAYGDNLSFNLRLDLQDIHQEDSEALGVLSHLLMDFYKGEIPLGGEKTTGFGWVQADITELQWMSGRENDELAAQLFGQRRFEQKGLWHTFTLRGEEAVLSLPLANFRPVDSSQVSKKAPRAYLGFISHRSFGGYCGTLAVEGEVLTPLNIKESGQPSFQTTLENEPINGWDSFSMSPPEASLRSDKRTYALPSKSIKGMLRHIYTIASDSKEPSPDITLLNPVDSLFGWVGAGSNQAIMGRISVNFAAFDDPKLAWFKIPYPYGKWAYLEGRWTTKKEVGVRPQQINNIWRIFPHTPLAPIVQKLDHFEPDIVQASYLRAILPGSRCRSTIRFWNLEKKELERLIWCLVLEDGLAHKIGQGRYLGLGSLRLRLLPESYLIHWEDRYSGKSEDNWRQPINLKEWINTSCIAHYDKLREILNADQI